MSQGATIRALRFVTRVVPFDRALCPRREPPCPRFPQPAMIEMHPLHFRPNHSVAVLLMFLTAAVSVSAQQAPATASVAQDARNLARYDANKNGRLDPEE